MSGQCYEPEEFERLLNLPDDHDDRRHLVNCGVCQAEFDFYCSFMSHDDVPAGANIGDAKTRLTNFLAMEIGAETNGAVSSAAASAGPRWNVRRWSAVLAAACIACVAIFINLSGEQRLVAPSGVVREMPGGPVTLATVTATTSEGFLLTWQGSVAADSYEVVILDTEMKPIDRFAVAPVGEVRIDRLKYPWLQKSGPYLWYLIARQDGDEIARSKVRTLEAGS